MENMTGGWKIDLVEEALSRLAKHERECMLCPRDCRVDRTTSRAGVCKTGTKAVVSHALLHYGEEPVISGKNLQGSGTIFFSGCNLKCLFCQNFQLSWQLEGREFSDSELAMAMIGLQKKGALNINLVTPTHVVLPILRALKIAFGLGLNLPIVWNSSGYEKAEVIAALEGIVDIWLPDFKYHSARISGRYSGAPDYFAHASEALKEMAFSRPALVLDDEETARRGLIVRHLVLPGHSDDSIELLRWLKDNLPSGIGLSLMSQYHPCFRAPEELRRHVLPAEYRKVAEFALNSGIENLFLQPEPFEAEEHLVPDFELDQPFSWRK